MALLAISGICFVGPTWVSWVVVSLVPPVLQFASAYIREAYASGSDSNMRGCVDVALFPEKNRTAFHSLTHWSTQCITGIIYKQ